MRRGLGALESAVRALGRAFKAQRTWGWAQQGFCASQRLFPWKPHFREVAMGEGVTAVEMAKMFFGQRFLTVRVFVVDSVTGSGGTSSPAMIDAGLACLSHRTAQYASERSVEQVLITHHHEDHSGGAHALSQTGATVSASHLTTALMSSPPTLTSDGLPVRFYQHLLWSQAPACCEVQPIAPSLTLPDGTAVQVLDVPGHCEDQVAFYMPDRGALFSGDAFIHERPKHFRADEDFHKSVESLRSLLTLDFDHLFCAHKPRIGNGKQALQEKLQWFEELQGRIEHLHARGWSDRAITRELLPRSTSGLVKEIMTLGDLSSLNLVQSVLYGPITRVEVDTLLARLRHPQP